MRRWCAAGAGRVKGLAGRGVAPRPDPGATKREGSQTWVAGTPPDDLAHLDRLALPITFVSGEHNHMFVPEGTARSLALLSEANDPALYQRHVIADYGHLDCLIGESAATDVFPMLAEALGRSISA